MRRIQFAYKPLTGLLVVLFVIGAVLRSPVHAVSVDDLLRETLCDVRVLYVYDDPEKIDWPVLYFLNDQFGCRVDLLTLGERDEVRHYAQSIGDREIYLHRLYLAAPDTARDSGKGSDSVQNTVDTLDLPEANISVLNGRDYAPLRAELFQDRVPDIVIFAAGDGAPLYDGCLTYLMYRMPAVGYFSIRKFFRPIQTRLKEDETKVLSINRRELFNRYREQMDYEIPQLFSWYRADDYQADQLGQYELIRSTVKDDGTQVGFLSGIPSIRLTDMIAREVPSGPMQATFLRLANEFISSYRAAIGADYRDRAESALRGFRQLLDLNKSARERAEPEMAPLKSYLSRLVGQAQRTALRTVGVDVAGDVVLRDTPHGPRVKYRLRASADGPTAVTLTDVQFHPYWDTSTVILDSNQQTILPHQSYVREFLVDVGRGHLESPETDSLLFTATVTYGTIPLTVRSSLPLRQAPKLKIKFEPDFFFVPPVAQIDVDRVVSYMNWKAVITKPRSYSGDVEFEFVPSRGIYAGAYKREITLRPGTTRETIRIPFSVSNLFEEGIQPQTISLKVADQLVAADTGFIRIASCRIADTITIGFLPDPQGRLEDVLRLTGVGFQPLTNRTLVTGDLDAYSVIIIGSGALEAYPSISLVKDRLLDFVRNGGSIVVFGQQEKDWTDNALPVSITPYEEFILPQQVTDKIPEANILSKPYKVSAADLIEAMKNGRTAFPAVVSPAEAVLETGRGSALLSVSRIGRGQVIYCGLPVLQLVSELNLDAIHLFANILNY
jgi:hypothetical protein